MTQGMCTFIFAIGSLLTIIIAILILSSFFTTYNLSKLLKNKAIGYASAVTAEIKEYK